MEDHNDKRVQKCIRSLALMFMMILGLFLINTNTSKAATGDDISSKLQNVVININRSKIGPNGPKNLADNELQPHNTIGLNYDLKATLPDNLVGGETFTVQLSDNVDISGVNSNQQTYVLPITYQGINIATGKYDPIKKTITYTISQSIKDVIGNHVSIAINQPLFIDYKTVPNSGDQTVKVSVGSNIAQKVFKVNYNTFVNDPGAQVFHVLQNMSNGDRDFTLDAVINPFGDYLYPKNTNYNYPGGSFLLEPIPGYTTTYSNIRVYQYNNNPPSGSLVETESRLNSSDMKNISNNVGMTTYTDGGVEIKLPTNNSRQYYVTADVHIEPTKNSSGNIESKIIYYGYAYDPSTNTYYQYPYSWLFQIYTQLGSTSSDTSVDLTVQKLWLDAKGNDISSKKDTEVRLYVVIASNEEEAKKMSRADAVTYSDGSTKAEVILTGKEKVAWTKVFDNIKKISSGQSYFVKEEIYNKDTGKYEPTEPTKVQSNGVYYKLVVNQEKSTNLSFDKIRNDVDRKVVDAPEGASIVVRAIKNDNRDQKLTDINGNEVKDITLDGVVDEYETKPWHAEFKDLPILTNPEDFYSVHEVSVNGTTTDYAGITNKPTMTDGKVTSPASIINVPLRQIKVTKKWEGVPEDERKEIEVRLLARRAGTNNPYRPVVEVAGEVVKEKAGIDMVSMATFNVDGNSVFANKILNAQNGRKATFEKIPPAILYLNELLEFTVEEVKVGGKEATKNGFELGNGVYVHPSVEEVEKNAYFEITNSSEFSIPVKKAWEGEIPSSDISMRLKASSDGGKTWYTAKDRDDNEISDIILNSSNEWKSVFERLPKVNQNEEDLSYKVVEMNGNDEVESGSISSIDGKNYRVKIYQPNENDISAQIVNEELMSISSDKEWQINGNVVSKDKAPQPNGNNKENKDNIYFALMYKAKELVGGKEKPLPLELQSGNQNDIGKYLIVKYEGKPIIFDNLPRVDTEGNIIEYSIREVRSATDPTQIRDAEDYEEKSQTDDEGNIKVINNYIGRKTIYGEKIWNGKSQSTTLQLYNADNLLDEITIDGEIDSDSNNTEKAAEISPWQIRFKDLPIYDINGNEIDYSKLHLKEVGEENGKITLSNVNYLVEDEKIDQAHYRITNTETRNLKVTKTWKNLGEGETPPDLFFKLLENDPINEYPIVKAIENEDGTWGYEWKNLPKEINGKAIEYTVLETGESGNLWYHPDFIAGAIKGNMKDGFEVTNTKAVEIPVEKQWLDAKGNPLKDASYKKPITIKLLANGELAKNLDGKEVEPIVLGEKSDFENDSNEEANDSNGEEIRKSSFKNLPYKDDKGNIIEYKIEEEPSINGFKTEITQPQYSNGNYSTAVVKNIQEETSVKVGKVWKGLSEGQQKPVVYFQLLSDDNKVVDTKILFTNESEISWDNLPTHNSDGNEISYEVKEVMLDSENMDTLNPKYIEWKSPGFTTTTSKDPENPNIRTFVNEYKPSEGDYSFKANKVLNGRDLVKGEFSFQLIDSEGNVVETTTNNEDGSILFKPIVATEIGEKTYKIKEVIPEERETGITYDDHEVDVTVNTRDESGKLISDISYSEDAVFKNQYTPTEGEYSFSATKVLDGRKLEDKEFEFELIDSNGDVIQTVSNDGEGNIVFEPIKATNSGNYTYKIKEVIPEEAEKSPGITYDEHEFIANVNVEDVNGKLVANVSYTGSAEFKNQYNEVSPAKINIYAEKEWIGGDENQRPDVYFQLYKDGIEEGDAKVITHPKKSVSREGLDNTKEDGTQIKYEVKEIKIPQNYTNDEKVSGVGSLEDPFVITNKYKEKTTPPPSQTTKIKVSKSRNNLGGEDANSYTAHFSLYGGDAFISEKTVTGNNEIVFEDLPIKDNDGNLIAYEVKEEQIPGFISEKTGNAEDGFVFTNIKNTGSHVSLIKEDSISGKRLPGAIFELYKVNDNKSASEEDKVSIEDLNEKNVKLNTEIDELEKELQDKEKELEEAKTDINSEAQNSSQRINEINARIDELESKEELSKEDQEELIGLKEEKENLESKEETDSPIDNEDTSKSIDEIKNKIDEDKKALEENQKNLDKLTESKEDDNEAIKLVGKYTTNELGEIEVDKLEVGEYYFIEKTAPIGYILDSEKKYEFKISEGENAESIVIIAKNTPKTPEKPNKPNIPNKPNEPNKPNVPDKPNDPDKPNVPEKPNKPNKPNEPNKPNIPEKPNKPNEPNKPGEPEKPVEPNTPHTPENPNNPHVVEPKTPGKTTPQKPGNKLPQTSDGISRALIASLVAIGGAGLTYFSIKSKKDNEEK